MKSPVSVFRIKIGTAERDITTPAHQLSLSQLVPVMHQITNIIVEEGVQHSGKSVRCGPGCGVCCFQLVPLSLPEVFFIVEQLLKMPVAERAVFLTRFEQNEKHLQACGLLDKLYALEEERNDTDVARDYFSQKVHCPFLQDGSCSIHQWRPVVCREYNVFSDPRLCADPFHHHITALQYKRKPSSALAFLTRAITNKKLPLIPLPLLFDVYEQYRELTDKTWPADTILQQLLDIVLEPGAH